jgi:hypothetical protein
VTGVAGAVAWWAEYYRTHDVAQLAAAFGHLLAIAYAARFALAGDAAALRLTSGVNHHARRAVADLATIRGAHVHVLSALSFALLTGLAQLLAQLAYLPASGVFWIKMSMLVLLLANGRIIQVTSARYDHADGRSMDMRLRAAAIRSIVLWCFIVLLGLLLTTVRPG